MNLEGYLDKPPPRSRIGGVVVYPCSWSMAYRALRKGFCASVPGRPSARSGHVQAPEPHRRPLCVLCGGARPKTCQWCDSTGRARAFCLDCGHWLPTCQCIAAFNRTNRRPLVNETRSSSSSYPPGAFPKTCTKCATILSKEEWLQLQCLGHQSDECEPPEVIELCNCKCGTTLGVPLEAING